MLWALSEEYTAGGVSIHNTGGGGGWQRGKECYPEGELVSALRIHSCDAPKTLETRVPVI